MRGGSQWLATVLAAAWGALKRQERNDARR
jgi:hypothetical protein